MTVMLALTFAIASWGQEEGGERRGMIIPGKAKINVENLKTFNDYKMNISKLSLCELKVLRNACYARHGYLFFSSEMRGIFNSTSWYGDLVYKQLEDEQVNGEIKLTPEEEAFTNRLREQEEKLKKNNFKVKKGQAVNFDNLLNPYQLEDMPAVLKQQLTKYGFGIVEADHDQLFQLYEKNDYALFPNFVTTDLYLQLFHLYFDCLLREVEQSKLNDAVISMSRQLYEEMTAVAKKTKNADVKDAAEWCAAYFAVAYSLATDKPLPALSSTYKALAQEEISKVKASQNSLSNFMEEYKNIEFGYSLFRPRGHYTRSETLERYFRAMMWLQTVPFGTDIKKEMGCAAIIAEALDRKSTIKTAYNRVYDPITFLMGKPDNVTITQLYDIMQSENVNAEMLINDPDALNRVAGQVDKLGNEQTRIRPVNADFEKTSHVKINFMPQRYQPDAEVMLYMVDYFNKSTKRGEPMGLDVMAALGSTAAERILIDELKQGKQWQEYLPTLNKMKQRMGEIDWNETVATTWMQALNTMNQRDSRFPYFMQTPQWDKKNLNASLASWAELKHDAILYAKQPMGAECGGEGLPPPVTKGYVEPNIHFWAKAVELLDKTQEVMTRFDMMSSKSQDITSRLREQAQFLLNVSNKELTGGKLVDEEYEQIRIIGSTFENISLELLKNGDEDIYGWADVSGADKKVALVADVYTANARNNPEKGVLYSAVGPANEIYVIVEIEGYLYLTRGAVFSYREFKRPLNEQRMTDEEWQKKLEEYPSTGKPSWMKEIIVPLKDMPEENESVFYSSGC